MKNILSLKSAFAAFLSLFCLGATAADVAVEETLIRIPTYRPGGYDKTPIFFTGRTYQGAQGRVYPYPMQDVLFDKKTDEDYKYLTMRNDWLDLGILPEHGGHLLNLTDRATGYETFYRQHVIKPALIGMLGTWISGGVEWNFPHHHRPSTAMPIDWRVTERRAGEPSDVIEFAGDARTIWLGETELRRRLKWTIGLTLLPDRAVLMAENVFMNRGPWIESMLYWANVAVSCNDDYQVIFPPSCHLGFDHHKRYWTSFPMGPSKQEGHWLTPTRRARFADDLARQMDLSWWKNFTLEPRSIFAMDPDNAWIVGYDHGRNAGTAHVSNRHITVGKKFFLWGNYPEAQTWDRMLTDKDGPYLELMVGCWSDNQPDYSWLAPYETRKVKQFWFPVKGIGGVRNATIDGAVNVDRRGADELLVGFHSTRVLKGCTVTLCRGRTPVFVEKGVAIDPNTPWCKPVKVDAAAADQEFTAAIADADGRVFLSYTPVGPDPKDPLPPIVDIPKEPKLYDSAELAYEVGLRLEQFHNGLLDPVPYYRRALEIDPDYTRANLALGVRLAKNARFAEAKPFLERAVRRATQNFTRATDAEPEYYLALVERELGNVRRAEDLLWRCTWRATVKKEAFLEIVRLCCLGGRYREAHDILEFNALPLGQDEAKFHTLHAYIHRRLKDSPDATAGQRAKWTELAANNAKKAFACDPLEYWGVVEAAFAAGDDGAAALAKAERNRGLKAQQLIETVCDYLNLGAWDEVIALCDAALAKAAAEKPYATEGPLPHEDLVAACDSYRNPMFAYFKAYAVEKRDEGRGTRDEIDEAVAAGEAMATDYCFPSRPEELAVLKRACQSPKAGANTFYYLGEILWNMEQRDDALAAWKTAAEKDPRHALALRCIAFALVHPNSYFMNTGSPSGVPNREGYEAYLKALEADPGNFRTLDEAVTLAGKLKLPAEERLALLEKHRATAEKFDLCFLKLAYVYNELGRYADALDVLTSRRFHMWEGGGGQIEPFIAACIGLGKAAMEKGDYAEAIRRFEQSVSYPDNLQAAKPNNAGVEPRSRYYIAQCRKALGDAAGCRAELEKALESWILAGEMDYWRVKALRELGREGECAPLLKELRDRIAELEAPPPKEINAYAKFGGDETPAERAAAARAQAAFLRGLLDELEDKKD